MPKVKNPVGFQHLATGLELDDEGVVALRAEKRLGVPALCTDQLINALVVAMGQHGVLPKDGAALELVRELRARVYAVGNFEKILREVDTAGENLIYTMSATHKLQNHLGVLQAQVMNLNSDIDRLQQQLHSLKEQVPTPIPGDRRVMI